MSFSALKHCHTNLPEASLTATSQVGQAQSPTVDCFWAR